MPLTADTFNVGNFIVFTIFAALLITLPITYIYSRFSKSRLGYTAGIALLSAIGMTLVGYIFSGIVGFGMCFGSARSCAPAVDFMLPLGFTIMVFIASLAFGFQMIYKASERSIDRIIRESLLPLIIVIVLSICVGVFAGITTA